jgi:hypothetical protein
MQAIIRKEVQILLILVCTVGIGLWVDQVNAEEERVRYDDGGILLDGPPNFVLDGRSWAPLCDLTYGFINLTSDFSGDRVRGAIKAALKLWEAVTPLTFTEVPDCGLPFDDPNCTQPNIRIQFAAGNHGDGFPFDGVSKTLAHAFFPPPNRLTAAGDAHFDEDEDWTDAERGNSSQPIDLVTVAAHEIGHSLGLNHAEADKCDGIGEDSLMCAFYEGSHRFLAQDDINGIEVLYNAQTCTAFEAATVTSFTGRAHGVGLGEKRAGVAIVGIFTSTGAIDLSAFPALTITRLFDEVGGAGEVAKNIPLTLVADPRNNANVAIFKTAVGVLPIAKVTIAALGGGRFTFRVDVAKATIVPPSLCPTADLRTSFRIVDGASPVVVATTQPWQCFGTGNRYLKSP